MTKSKKSTINSKSKYADYDRISEQIDTSMRDIEIRAFWEGLRYSDLKYEEKMHMITSDYFISQKTVESIIKVRLIDRL
tara:strand:+ start:20 stop:256 length:237 start_codon:yes stop_codon:yes gene_type:complete